MTTIAASMTSGPTETTPAQGDSSGKNYSSYHEIISVEARVVQLYFSFTPINCLMRIFRFYSDADNLAAAVATYKAINNGSNGGQVDTNHLLDALPGMLQQQHQMQISNGKL